MSLQTRLAALITAIGTDIKTLQTRVLPVGGTTGQNLRKKTSADYDTEWANPTGGAGLPEIYIGDAQPTRNAELLWIDTDEVAPATLNVTMDPWHIVGAAGEPAFGANWIHYDTTLYNSVGFRKFPDGTVMLKGLGRYSGAWPPSAVSAFTLPVGYRPPKRMFFQPRGNSGTSTIQMQLNTDGTMLFSGGVADWVSFEGIEFDTESVLQTASVAAQPLDTWHTVGAAGEPAFNAPWTNLGGAYNTVGFRKDVNGRVYLRGVAAVSSGPGAVTRVFSLPAGYRPPLQAMIESLSISGHVRVDIDTTGQVVPSFTPTAGQWVSLEGLSFDTETVSAYASGVIGPQRVTSLPANAIDGQEVYFVADATNGVIWHLRYNAGSASAYKWELVGGSPLRAHVAADETVTTGTASAGTQDLTTLGPDVTVPLAGDYDMEFGCTSYIGSAAASPTTSRAGLVLGAGTTTYSTPLIGSTAIFNDVSYGSQRRHRMTGLTANQLVRMRYTGTGGSVPRYAERFIFATPVRVG